MATPHSNQSLVELEIAAFMGPHIKRARIVLVVLGVLYAIFGYLTWGDIAELSKQVESWNRLDDSGALLEIEGELSTLKMMIGFMIFAGVADVVLAVIAGKHTMIAFYAAMAIFSAVTLFQIWVSDGAIFSNPLWWLTAVCIGLGFQAALKAERLRRDGSSALRAG